MSDFQLAVALSLSAAFIFAVGAQLTRYGLRTIDPQSGALVSIAAATVLYWCVAPWQLSVAMFASSAVWLFVLVGMFRPAVSSTCAMIGTAILGPTVSTTLSSTAPFFGLAFGVAFLGESLTVPVTVGTLSIVIGVIALAKRDGKGEDTSWPLWALALPVLAAVIRVGAHLLTKVGMEEIPSAYFAGLVAYNASLAVAVTTFILRRQSVLTLMRDPNVHWFMGAGVAFGIAVLLVNVALQFGPLSVVAPLVSLEAIFVLALGLTIFKEGRLTLRIVVAVTLVVAGAVAISAR